MQTALKAVALLLHYPDAESRDLADDMRQALTATPELGDARSEIEAFVRDWARLDLLDLQAEYVETFDRGRQRSLYLFEHLHGESRDRGQAMVDLLTAYREQGLEIASNELPDYLPLFLEFCARLPDDNRREWLGEVIPLLQPVQTRLVQRESRYAQPFSWLLKLAGGEPLPAMEQEKLAAEKPDDTPQALDEAWEEAPVTFGPENDTNTACAPGRPHDQVPLRWVDPRGLGALADSGQH